MRNKSFFYQKGWMRLAGMLMALLFSFLTPANAQTTKEIEALQKRMYYFYSRSEHEPFFAAADSLMEAAKAAGDEHTFYKTWGNKAIYTFNKVAYADGLKLTNEMKKYAEEHDSDYGLLTATYAAGSMQATMGLHEEAEASYLSAIEYTHKYFPNESAAAPYLGLARIELGRKHYDKVLEFTKKALEEPHVNMQHQLSAWSYKCMVRFHIGDYDGFEKAYAEREKVKAAYGQDDNFGTHVEIYHADIEGDHHKALELARQLKSNVTRMALTAEELAKLGDYKSAYEELYMLKEHRDTVNVETIRKLASEFAVEMDLARAENEAKDLRLANQEQAEHAHHILMAVVGFALLIVIALLSFIAIRQRHHERRLQASNEKLRETNEILKTTYSELEETTKAKERHESELRIARDIQRSMVPMKFPAFPDHAEIDLYAFIRAAKGVGGDLYDYSILNDKLYFCLGDVSGKGVPAALFMVEAISVFRTEVKECVTPDVIAYRMNETLVAENENGMFVTMFIGMLDLKSGYLDFCNCGHNPPVLFGPSQQGDEECHFLEVESNAPIGLWPELEYVGEHIDSMMNKTLFLYSDGLNEAENKQQEQFSDERVLANLKRQDSPTSQQTIFSLLSELTQFVNGAEQSDDLTMLCIKLAEDHTVAKTLA